MLCLSSSKKSFDVDFVLENGRDRDVSIDVDRFVSSARHKPERMDSDQLRAVSLARLFVEDVEKKCPNSTGTFNVFFVLFVVFPCFASANTKKCLEK